jgi:hypothetical protein
VQVDLEYRDLRYKDRTRVYFFLQYHQRDFYRNHQSLTIMAGVSTFINPASTGTLLIFFNTKNYNLALQTRDASSSDKDETSYSAADVSNKDGLIMDQSSLATITMNGLVHTSLSLSS